MVEYNPSKTVSDECASRRLGRSQMGVRTRLRRHRPPALIRRQRGAALIFVVLLMVVGIGLFVVNASTETARVAQSDAKLAAGLNAAKEALIAYAVAHTARPGALPCPDIDNDGLADPPGAGACSRYLGRLPWRTLGIGDVRDHDGELLWYALSDLLRDGVAISSDTKGNRTVRSGTAAVTQTIEAVAVVFAPGGVLAGQARDSTAAICATTGANVARNLCPANYLETAAGVNNAALTGPYIAADPSPSFNDRLIVLRTSDLIPLVERRVAGDLRRVLFAYRQASKGAITGGGCNCYPWPDSDFDGSSNTDNNKGRIPITAAPHNWGTTLKDGAGNVFTLPTLPPYFQANGWNSIIFYTVGRNALENLGTGCSNCTDDPLLPPPTLLKGTLSIDKNIGHAVVLITPGSAGASRPSGNWGDYIDDGMNRDGDDRFVTPASKSPDRDRLFTIADDLPPASCNTNAQMLIYNAPCKLQGNTPKPVCQQAASNLQFCTCSGDATAMINPPCRNTLNPPACQAAVASLQACKL